MRSSSQPETSAAGGAVSDRDLVRTAARAFERDRYLAALLAPSAVRADLVALAAFAGELARIAAYVSEPMVGEIRLQWWRDTLQAGIGRGDGDGDVDAREVGGEQRGGGGHPIAAAVIAAARRHRVPVSAFTDVIEAQVARLDDQPFATVEALLANARAWDGGLFGIAGRMLDSSGLNDAEPEEMLLEAGTVYGFVRVLLDTPVDLTQGRCLLPVDVCVSHAATLGVALGSKQLSAFDFARQEVAGMVTPRLDVVRELFQEAPRASRIAALPLALVQPYLDVCRGGGVAAGAVSDIGPLKRVWRLWLSHRLGRLVD